MKQTQFHFGKKNGQCLGSSNEGSGLYKGPQYTYDSQKRKKNNLETSQRELFEEKQNQILHKKNRAKLEAKGHD